MAAMLKAKLRIIFPSATAVWPDVNKLLVSKAKAENVLKPPQKPVINSNFSSVVLSFPATKPTIIPAIKQLKKFAVSVAKGKFR